MTTHEHNRDEAIKGIVLMLPGLSLEDSVHLRELLEKFWQSARDDAFEAAKEKIRNAQWIGGPDK